VRQWHYANSVRYAAAMQGLDYAAFKNGYWELTNNLGEMEQLYGSRRKEEDSLICYIGLIGSIG
jgi:hypothetical protein